MNNTSTITFSISEQTKEFLGRLYKELNRPVTQDELLTLLLKTYYHRTAEAALLTESQLSTPRVEGKNTGRQPAIQPTDEIITGGISESPPPAFLRGTRVRDYTPPTEPPEVRVSGRPTYTKHGVWYSSIEPRISR